MKIDQINKELPEGRLLLLALGKMSEETQKNKTPQEILDVLLGKHEVVYKKPLMVTEEQKRSIRNSTEMEFSFSDRVRILFGRRVASLIQIDCIIYPQFGIEATKADTHVERFIPKKTLTKTSPAQ